MKEKWTVHIDLISYDSRTQDNGTSAINLHVDFDSEKEMRAAYDHYLAALGQQISIHGKYIITDVEPSLYPVLKEEAGPPLD